MDTDEEASHHERGYTETRCVRIEHADAAQQRGHQGIAHKAAVGEHCGEAQAVLPFTVSIADQQHLSLIHI